MRMYLDRFIYWLVNWLNRRLIILLCLMLLMFVDEHGRWVEWFYVRLGRMVIDRRQYSEGFWEDDGLMNGSLQVLSWWMMVEVFVGSELMNDGWSFCWFWVDEWWLKFLLILSRWMMVEFFVDSVILCWLLFLICFLLVMLFCFLVYWLGFIFCWFFLVWLLCCQNVPPSPILKLWLCSVIRDGIGGKLLRLWT